MIKLKKSQNVIKRIIYPTKQVEKADVINRILLFIEHKIIQEAQYQLGFRQDDYKVFIKLNSSLK